MIDLPVAFDVDVRNYLHLFREQGQDVSALEQRLAELEQRWPEPDDRRDQPAWKALEREVLERDAGDRADEPSDRAAIEAARPSGRTDTCPAAAIPTGEALRQKVAGAWLGRIAGCVLGKPVEPLMRHKDSRARQVELLKQAGEYPLSDYFSEAILEPEWQARGDAPKWFTGWKGTLRGHIEQAPSDDDLNYTVLAVETLHGLRLKAGSDTAGDAGEGGELTPDTVLRSWLGRLPFGAVCTAEKLAYRNGALGLRYPDAARFLNPYREWIGAQIRADVYGYVCPGQPAAAAGLAWADAACSHTANGVYGAMWVAACLAAAFCEDDPEAVLRRGLEQVPADCRFAHHVTQTVEAALSHGDDFEATFRDIERRLGHYHCVHAINNACVVAAAVMHGGGDYARTITIAVMGGLDTDCNGATAGSIAGAMLGRDGIDPRWYECFHDTLNSAVRGCQQVRISAMIDRTLELVGRFA